MVGLIVRARRIFPLSRGKASRVRRGYVAPADLSDGELVVDLLERTAESPPSLTPSRPRWSKTTYSKTYEVSAANHWKRSAFVESPWRSRHDSKVRPAVQETPGDGRRAPESSQNRSACARSRPFVPRVDTEVDTAGATPGTATPHQYFSQPQPQGP
jgi:hypothetical protein